jgi:hypothetical protein
MSWVPNVACGSSAQRPMLGGDESSSIKAHSWGD